MEYKTIKRYFKTSYLPLFIGIGISGIGYGIYYFFSYLSNIFYQGGAILAIGGVMSIIFFFAQMVSASTLDRCVSDKIKQYTTELDASFKPSSRLAPPEAMVIGDYVISDETLPIRKGRDSKYRTNQYKMAWIVAEHKKLTIATKAFSLFDDSVVEEYNKFDYTDIGEIEFFENFRTLKNGKTVKYYTYVIKVKDGKIVLDTPVRNDVTVDLIREKIEHNREMILRSQGADA